ncbi:MAG: ABC transporter ATP-binding protein/permease [Eubacterium sp.]|nr:ABC transporter ATP-binding protein/permease [Eubacterium sp.]
MKFLKGLWFAAIVGSLGMVLEASCPLYLPKIMGRIIDNGVTPVINGTVTAADGRAYVLKEAVIMIIVALVAIAGGITCMKLSSDVSQKFAARIRNAMFKKISSFSFKNIDEFSTASLTTRLTNDVTMIQNVTMMILRMLIRMPSLLIVASFFAVSINARLASMLLFALPLILIAAGVVMKVGFPMFRKMQKKIDALNGVVQENLIGIRVVKAFVREEHEKKKFKIANDDLSRMGAKAAGMIILAMPLMMLIFNLTLVTVIYRGGVSISIGEMSTGDLISFISYVMEILMSIMMVAMMLVMVVRGKACADRIKEVLDAEIDIVNKNETLSADKRGKVAFEHVNFRYSTQTDGDDILNDISFTAEPGQIIGIVGGTGCGKSSLVSLIPRLYDATGGKVLIDGVDVRDYDIEELRELIGVVLQNNVLFTGTIKENIRWGKKDATDEEIIAACKAAQAHDFIMRQPDGYDTVLAQGGLNLSGGQKQRLCIARAMIKKPKILILDDSTSAVDTATEAKIRNAFYNELKDTTIFIIAQRISSVKDADEILVMDDGEIKGIGKHDELMETNEIYQEIYHTQQKGVIE